MAERAGEDLKGEAAGVLLANHPPLDKAPTECNVGHLCGAFEALSTLANEKIDSKATAKIVRLMRWTEEIYHEFSVLKKETLERLGTLRDGTENTYAIPHENVQECLDILTKASQHPVLIPKRLKLALSDLEGAKVSPATMLRMRWFLSDLAEEST